MIQDLATSLPNSPESLETVSLYPTICSPTFPHPQHVSNHGLRVDMTCYALRESLASRNIVHVSVTQMAF